MDLDPEFRKPKQYKSSVTFLSVKDNDASVRRSSLNKLSQKSSQQAMIPATKLNFMSNYQHKLTYYSKALNEDQLNDS